MKKILMVEDDLFISMINKKCLEQLGHNVILVIRNGLDAIEAAKNLNPDVILMDVRIAGEIDGIEAMEEIRKFSDVDVIYISGDSDPETLLRAEKTRMLGFRIKPIFIDDLKDLLA